MKELTRTNDTTNAPTDQERILAVFDALAAAQPVALQRLLAGAGYPPGADAFVELAATLAAIRRAIGRYTPRPAFAPADATDPASLKEQAAWNLLLTDLVTEATANVAQPYCARAARVTAWASGRLTAWNKSRPAQQVTLTAEERALFANRVPPDKRDTLDVEDVGHRTFIIHPNIHESRD